ncbi:MAG: UDP-N-acetylmuramate--L-alanine ligase [Bacteroidales bacterium]|nr:UDP-N-acetylmuramate--L-alanine ligase [Bacteroidales bacterium]
MNLNNLHSIYFLGIGGIGMSGMARYFQAKGVKISGYDKTSTALTQKLIEEGMDIHFEDNINLIPSIIDMVVYTPAIPSDNKEFVYFTENGFEIKKRSEILGLIIKDKKGIAVAGTHGKTTVSTLIAHLLKQSDVDCTAFLGGISKNYNTNLLLSDKSDYIVVEADEFDKSFLQLNPFIAVITSADADHLDIYGKKEKINESFTQFTEQIQKNGKLIIKHGLDLQISIKDFFEIYYYSFNTKSNFYAKNIKLKDGLYNFDFVYPFDEIKDITLGLPGLMNVENAVAAISVAFLLGVDEDDIRKSLKSFAGIKRRFEYQVKTKDLVYIDDYAHHPEELKACINSVRELYPGKKITGVFQPHLYSRTRDFADEFANSLALLDEVILLEIYPAREKAIKNVNSKMLLDKIKVQNKKLCSGTGLIDELKSRNIEILLTLGAGDIDQLVEPIKNSLMLKV